MMSVSYAGKNVYSAGKTSDLLWDGALGTNWGYLLFTVLKVPCAMIHFVNKLVIAFLFPNCPSY